MDKNEFSGLELQEKFKLLKLSAEYVAGRTYNGYFVHLFEIDGFFIEGWMRIGTEGYQWIEIVNNDDSLDAYLENININFR